MDRPARTAGGKKESNGWAIAALVCGIVGAVGGLIPLLYWLAWGLGLLALVFGVIAIRQGGRERSGTGMGWAGAILGVVAIGFGAIGYAAIDDAVDDLDRAGDKLKKQFDDLDDDF